MTKSTLFSLLVFVLSSSGAFASQFHCHSADFTTDLTFDDGDGSLDHASVSYKGKDYGDDITDQKTRTGTKQTDGELIIRLNTKEAQFNLSAKATGVDLKGQKTFAGTYETAGFEDARQKGPLSCEVTE